jgi:pimeloyl-ACP methyl ester carboxylesterase
MKKIIFSLWVTSLMMFTAFGQELPRSASFGALISNLDDSTANLLRLPSSKGTLLKQVIGGSSAGKAGLINNDVLISFDGKVIDNTNHFLSILKEYHGGDKVKVNYYRQAELKTATIILQAKAKETSKDYDIIYSSIHSANNYLRTIITKPKGEGIYPAVMIVGGVGCYSIDNISNPDLLSFRLWVDSLTANGFVTIRIEKTGMGDSKGIPCTECDFLTEKQGFSDGLKQLKSLPYVDKENVFIAGFSIGGVIAPLIAQQEKVKGIIVYGTVGRNWLEYELENTHRQRLLEDYPADSLDLLMRAEYKRLYGLFVEKKTPEQIINEHPETAGAFFEYPMGVKYFQQVADINIRQLWMNTDAYVLAMHGTSDFVSSASEHELIVQTVNRYYPNKATHTEIENADHWGLYTKSEKISQSHNQTELNPLAVTTALRWILKVVKAVN